MVILLLVLILIAVSALSLGSCFFLADRFTLYLGLANRKLLFAIFLWFFTLAGAGSAGFLHSTHAIGSNIHRICALSLGFYLYLILCTLVVELLRRLFKFKHKYTAVLALAGTISVCTYGVYNAYQLVITERTIAVEGLTEPLKMVHLTDTHLGQFRGRENLQQVVDAINKINPDVVFHTGDLLDSRVHLKDNVLAPLAEIKAPVFFVDGNHDIDTDILAIAEQLRALNVRFLQNEVVEFEGVQLVGLRYMYADNDSFRSIFKPSRLTLKNTLPQIELDQQKPIILLHHAPRGMEYAQKAGVDLYLAGHTHGGQMFPFNFIADWLFEFNAGLFDFKGMKVNIPFGVGTYSVPMRIGTKSEFSVINLIPLDGR